MGHFIGKLIINFLRLCKLVGDATIWGFKKLFLAIKYVVRFFYFVTELPFIIVRMLVRIGTFIGIYGYRLVKKIPLPLFIVNRKTAAKKGKDVRHSIGHIAKKRGQKSQGNFWIVIKSFAVGFGLASIILGSYSLYYILSKDLPRPELLTKRDIPLTTKIYDRNDELLYEIYADQNRTAVKLDELPDYFVNGTIAIEDRSFYRHQGFSPRGIVRAAYNIVIHDELQGGSTITQQLVRSALLNQDVSLYRKIKELILSIWTEQLYSKEEILTMYFNQVPYGGTAWGAEAAAQTYFGKSIREVSLGEAALLAGLPAAPTTFSPRGAHPEFARLRQLEVLRRMEEDGFITTAEREQAEKEELVYAPANIGIKAPHFVMYVRQLLSEQYGPRMVEQGGLIVHTSLDLSLQDEVQKIVTDEVTSLKSFNVGNGAALVTDPKTGEILAMVGSVDYFNTEKEGNVNVALTAQLPGSSIKVVTYTAALQNGFTAATLLNDSPITYTAQGSNPYSPVNYDGKFHGTLPLRFALGNSLNIPAVRTLAKIGIPAMIDQGRKMGIDSWKDTDRYGLSLTLGGGEVTMLDMAEVYGTLANRGAHHELNPIIKITDHLGNVLEDNSTSPAEQVVPEDVSFIISDILSDNSARTSAFGPNSDLHVPNSWVAAKTGTSNDKMDNWAIGFTRDFIVTVWVGNNNNKPMYNIASGITGATPIWRHIIDRLLTTYPSSQPEVPVTVVSVPCRGRTEYFVKGTEPAHGCQAIPQPSPTPGSDSIQPH